jgi:kynureninase
MNFSNQLDFALELDASDSLKSYRDLFHIPTHHGDEVAYFTGNSLGLQPKSARAYVERVMKDWETMAVEGHFYSKEPWWEYHE